MQYLCLIFLVLLAGCGSQMTAWQEEKSRDQLVFEEMRLEISDLKHALHGAKTEIALLDEKLKTPPKITSKQPDFAAQIAQLERKIMDLQRTQERLHQDLKTLSTEVALHTQRLEEVVKLKGTLSSLSQVLKGRSSPSGKRYTVKSGDSLEKIAKQQGLSVETLKRLNQLSSDRIIVGQEILLADE